MSVKTYTLFLPDITEDDLIPDGSEFEYIQDYEDYENLYKIIDVHVSDSLFSDSEGGTACGMDGIDRADLTDLADDANCDDDSEQEYSHTSDEDRPGSETDYYIPEVISPQSTYSNIFDSETMETQSYDEIPMYYSGVKNWIKSTNILCISCSNKIQGMPMFIPLSWHNRVITKKVDTTLENDYNITELDPLNNYQSNEINTEQKVMKVHYLTCNERCAKRYITHVKDPKISDKWQCLQLLKELVQNMKGIRITDIEEGLDKGIQMQYCGAGGISVQKFRELNSSDDKHKKK